MPIISNTPKLSKMRLFLLSFTFLAFFTACQTKQNSQQVTLPAGTHMVVVQEFLHTSEYTYLRVKENEKELWLALPHLADAKVGATYYYDGGMLMTNFDSKELNRKFAEVYFLEGVRTTPEKQQQTTNVRKDSNYTAKVVIEKKDIKVAPVAGSITIEKIYANKQQYAGKTVKVTGEVTKFNAGIMNKNWIHIQDGTEYAGKFDFTATTDAEVKVGDKVTLEGKISLAKDFGYGYFYEVLMEDTKVIKK